ncbi:hypothetical protein ARMGADRAFT_425320 [Armillaria gallica]|uniref:Uncharacterized protein n=1 Tax=Armillaria gallica TaxID=47427 RepID=A0A2H3E4Y9_ARMGA|nr:hypothetical protein ARMGADRAFT_425320 [Armillaria gallica]
MLIPSLALAHYTPSSTRDSGRILTQTQPTKTLTLLRMTGNIPVRLAISSSIERVAPEYMSTHIPVLHHYLGATPTCTTAIETVLRYSWHSVSCRSYIHHKIAFLPSFVFPALIQFVFELPVLTCETNQFQLIEGLGPLSHNTDGYAV